jgi:hypothetical protein
VIFGDSPMLFVVFAILTMVLASEINPPITQNAEYTYAGPGGAGGAAILGLVVVIAIVIGALFIKNK